MDINNVFQSSFIDVNKHNVSFYHNSSKDTDSDTPDEEDLFDEQNLKNVAMRTEMDCYSQLRTSMTQNTNEDQLMISQTIISKLDEALEITRLSNSTDHDESISICDSHLSFEMNSINSLLSNNNRSYPPILQTGIIHDHDRPYAEYGHLGKILKRFF